jgi:glycerophosphoryl diester phosphodiesterase
VQTYYELTSDSYLDFLSNYVLGIGPWKDTIVFPTNNYLDAATDLVARAHAHGLQVHILSVLDCYWRLVYIWLIKAVQCVIFAA